MSPPLKIRLLPDLAPPDLHAALWRETGEAGSWSFGHSSGAEEGVPFWYLDLGRCAAASRMWEHARPTCEEHLGVTLRMLRQYANGHTYGQGGRLHQDDFDEGTYTLLYYPMPDWPDEWEGETIFENGRGDVVAAVRPAPNRAILFDSRIPHAGRGPSRRCPGLRVTIAFKLRATGPTPEA